MTSDSYFICKSHNENSVILKRTEPGYVVTTETTRPIPAEKIVESILIDFENKDITLIQDHIGIKTDPWYYIWVDRTWIEITERDYKNYKYDFKKCEKFYNEHFKK